MTIIASIQYMYIHIIYCILKRITHAAAYKLHKYIYTIIYTYTIYAHFLLSLSRVYVYTPAIILTLSLYDT